MAKGPFTTIVRTLERTARNGTRAHIDPADIKDLIKHPVYLEMLAEGQRELIAFIERQEQAEGEGG